MKKILTMVVASMFVFSVAACGDDDSTGDNCTDLDGDGYGVGADCMGADCNDDDATCYTVGDACCGATDCVDADGDGYGVGVDCTGTDCNDSDSMCWNDGDACCGATVCQSDVDGDGYGADADCLGADCDETDDQCWAGACCQLDCVDADGDTYGVGADCAGPDCNDMDVACHEGTCCPDPGNGNVGEACTDVSQCTGITNGTPECLTTVFIITFTGGYCTGSTCTVGQPCDASGDSECLDLAGYAQYCVKTCTSAADCRVSEGYDCVTAPGGQAGDPTYCLPPMGM